MYANLPLFAMPALQPNYIRLFYLTNHCFGSFVV